MIAIRRLELGLPGLIIGVVAGLIAGGLSLLAGQPIGWAALSTVTLAAPLGLLGAGYSLMLGHGLFRPGVFAPAALYWMVGFPLGRLCQESMTDLALSGRVSLTESLPAFLAFQAMVSVGFAIGFIWLHERLAPYWLMRIQDDNPRARALLGRYVTYSEALWQAKEKREAARRERRDAHGVRADLRSPPDALRPGRAGDARSRRR